MPLSRAQKKYVAVARARRRLQHRLDDIDWEMDVLAEEVKAIGELEETKVVEIEVGEVEDEPAA